MSDSLSSTPSSTSTALPPLRALSRFSLSDPTTYERLNLAPFHRIAIGTTGGLCTGLLLGGIYGAQMASLRFRAENTHRLPKTTKGWYLYHKTKNYHMMYYGLGEALRMGFKISFWTGSLLTAEAAVDHLRGERRDFVSSVAAGLSVAGAFSAVNKFPVHTAAQTARMGLASGLAFGLIQDAMSLARGKRLKYVDFILRRKDKPDETTNG